MHPWMTGQFTAVNFDRNNIHCITNLFFWIISTSLHYRFIIYLWIHHLRVGQVLELLAREVVSNNTVSTSSGTYILSTGLTLAKSLNCIVPGSWLAMQSSAEYSSRPTTGAEQQWVRLIQCSIKK